MLAGSLAELSKTWQGWAEWQPFTFWFSSSWLSFAGGQRAAEYQGAIYFASRSAGYGSELWRVHENGTKELVEDIRVGPASSSPKNFILFDDSLFFTANDGATGRELWRLDSAGQPTLVADFSPGEASTVILRSVVFADQLFLIGGETGASTQLLHYTTGGTIEPVPYGEHGLHSVQILGVFGDSLVVRGTAAQMDNALWPGPRHLYQIDSAGVVSLGEEPWWSYVTNFSLDDDLVLPFGKRQSQSDRQLTDKAPPWSEEATTEVLHPRDRGVAADAKDVWKDAAGGNAESTEFCDWLENPLESGFRSGMFDHWLAARQGDELI